jgi:hypothetical protein
MVSKLSVNQMQSAAPVASWPPVMFLKASPPGHRPTTITYVRQ